MLSASTFLLTRPRNSAAFLSLCRRNSPAATTAVTSNHYHTTVPSCHFSTSYSNSSNNNNNNRPPRFKPANDFSPVLMAAATRPRLSLHAHSTVRLSSSSSSSSSGDPKEEETTRTDEQQTTPSLPVGIFVDLDNVQLIPKRKGIEDGFVAPLQRLVKSLGGEISAFEAFANRATQTWTKHDEDGDDEDDDSEEEETTEWMEWDGQKAQTGHDQDGVLRCGICGSRMQVTKKDKQKGLTEYDKLHRHMKMLHDKEQEKRKNRSKHLKQQKKKKKLPQKEREKFQKYKSAQVGLSRLPGNDLFVILKENKIRRWSSENVDDHLMARANKWIAGTNNKQNAPTKDNNNSDSHRTTSGVLMVVSEDSDFCPLLLSARSSGMIAISVTLNEKQTGKLRLVSDAVITFHGETNKLQWEALSLRGERLQERLLDT